MSRTVHLACLCAAWCRMCDEYSPVLIAAAQAFGAQDVSIHVHWIDIEDEAELVGDFDVQTFPTLVIVTDDQLRFAGPVRPQAEALIRVLRATVLDKHASTPASAFPAEVQSFATQLSHRSGNRPPNAAR